DVAVVVQVQVLGVVAAAAAQVVGERQGRAGVVELDDEAVVAAVGAGVEGAGRGREVGRGRLARHVDAADGVQGDAGGAVVAAAAQVGGEGQGRAVGQQPGDEDIVAAVGAGVDDAGRGRKVGRVGQARNEDAVGGVQEDVRGAVGAAAAQVSGGEDGVPQDA